MEHQLRGADILWGALKRGGVTRVFSLSGNHIMPVYDAAFGQGIEIVHVRHEAAAVHMADAWARLTGEVGVALVTGGQGHSNAVAALPTALAGEVPVVLLSGHAPLNELGMGAFQETPQVDMAAPLCKAAWLAQSTDGLAEDIARAFALARGGRPGPVHVFPAHRRRRGQGRAAPAGPRGLPSGTHAALAGAARAVLDMLQAAQRPVICASSALNTEEGLAALAALEAACGLPVTLMESPRGLLDPAIGDFGSMLAQADLVLLLGKQLDFTLKFGRTTPARFAVIEPAGALVDRAGRLLGERLALVARAAPLEAARTLADAAKPHPSHGWAAELRTAMDHRPAAWAELTGRAGPIHPATLGAALRTWLEGDCVLVADGGEVGQWMQAMLRAPARVTNGVAGAIGAGIPFAVAASAARPGKRILAVWGTVPPASTSPSSTPRCGTACLSFASSATMPGGTPSTRSRFGSTAATALMAASWRRPPATTWWPKRSAATGSS
jgi:acetolactate synthase-1/2/3 large subunit